MTNKIHDLSLTVATVLPFTPDGVIDWPSYHRVLDYCTKQAGITAVFVNGHAGDASALTDEERGEVLRVTRAAIGPNKKMVAGLVAHSTAAAIAQAKQARELGADVLTVFPPGSFGTGGVLLGSLIETYVRAIDAAVDMPLAIFQYPLTSGSGYDTPTLLRLAEIPNVIAIKEGSDSMLAYEQNYRALKAARPDLQVLPSNFDWFLAQLAVGGDGLLSGLASLAPDQLIELLEASKRLDLAAMREVNDCMWTLVRAIYTPPRVEMYARIKVALQLLGVIDHAYARAPMLPVSEATTAKIAAALKDCGLKQFAR